MEYSAPTDADLGLVGSEVGGKVADAKSRTRIAIARSVPTALLRPHMA